MRPPIRKSIRLKVITLFSDIKNTPRGTPHTLDSNPGGRGGEGVVIESLKGRNSVIGLSVVVLSGLSILITKGLALMILSRMTRSCTTAITTRDTAIEKYRKYFFLAKKRGRRT